MPKKTLVERAQAAVDAAVEAVIQQGGVVHEDRMWDAAELALEGASPEVLVETINGTRTEAYVLRSGWATKGAGL